MPHHPHARDHIDAQLHVITCCFNPVRYQSRWDLYANFEKHITDAGAQLHVIEAAFGERAHVIPPTTNSSGRVHHIPVRVDHLQEIWLKENLLNLALQRIPESAKYIAFVDADTLFTRPDIVEETIHQLQHFHVVQMFSDAIDLNPHFEPQQNVRQRSHMWCHVHGELGEDCYGRPSAKVSVNGGRIYRHPGFAWAWRREALNHVGGLMDHVLMGSADWHMAWALIGRVEETLSRQLSDPYKRRCRLWERRAMEHIKMNVGYVDGTILHHWHGKKRDRGYASRWSIMAKHGFDPDMDLKTDWQGVIRLTDTKPGLRDDIRAYMRARNEDSVDE